MAIKPTKPTVPPAPSRVNPGAEFATRADTFAAFQTTLADYMDATSEFVDERADQALAAAVGSTLPSISNRAGQYVRVNAVGTAVEFAPSSDPENRIINGGFDIWQRGTSFTALAYGADRWINGVAGGTVTQERVATVVGQPFGGNVPRFFLRQTVSGQTLTSHLASTEQRIEGVRSYAGQTITVLGWARRASGAGNMAVEAVQNFGTGGSPSASVFSISVTTVPLTASWVPFAVVMTIPSITARTIGANGNDYLSINFWTSAGSSLNPRTNSLGLQTIGVDLWGIHIRVGSHTASANDVYVAPEIGPEIQRCQRYYTVVETIFSGVVTSGVQYVALANLPTTMRGTPTAVAAERFSVGFPTAPAASTLFPSASAVAEQRTANATVNGGRFQSSVPLDAEL